MNTLQKKAYKLMEDGKNVFITGGGGVGKSYLLKRFARQYRRIKFVGMTSMTAISALLIKGRTLHSFLGIGLGKNPIDFLYTKIMKKKQYRKVWQNLDVLIIDEISMMSVTLFEKLEGLARRIRQNNQPFGGIQLIFSGDFCQLPAINEQRFCFESSIWDECVTNTVYLTEIIRQKNKVFQSVLQSLRMGQITEEVKTVLGKCINRKLESKHSVKPTRIYSLNRNVNHINLKKLNKLKNKQENPNAKEYTLIYKIHKKKDEYKGFKFLKNLPVNETLVLLENAQVMLVHNLSLKDGLVNGSRGVVTGFSSGYPVVKFLNGVERVIEPHTWELEEEDVQLGFASQIPLRLAYASTIHKLQGSTIDYAVLYLDSIFEYGMGYVALSRVRTLDGLSIRSMDLSKFKAHPKAVEYYTKLERQTVNLKTE